LDENDRILSVIRKLKNWNKTLFNYFSYIRIDLFSCSGEQPSKNGCFRFRHSMILKISKRR